MNALVDDDPSNFQLEEAGEGMVLSRLVTYSWVGVIYRRLDRRLLQPQAAA
jgi:hypothetical protein